MTTKEHFFIDLFDKTEKAKVLYKNTDFKKFSDEERKFLDRLTIFSKYSNYIKSKLIVNKNLLNKRQYIEFYSSNLKYKEFVKLEEACEIYTEKKKMTGYLHMFSSIALITYYIYINPTGTSVNKTIFKCLFLASITSIPYFLYHRQIKYKPIIDFYYKTLSDRINNKKDSTEVGENTMESYFTY